jgi:hypothetical protein
MWAQNPVSRNYDMDRIWSQGRSPTGKQAAAATDSVSHTYPVYSPPPCLPRQGRNSVSVVFKWSSLSALIPSRSVHLITCDERPAINQPSCTHHQDFVSRSTQPRHHLRTTSHYKMVNMLIPRATFYCPVNVKINTS